MGWVPEGGSAAEEKARRLLDIEADATDIGIGNGIGNGIGRCAVFALALALAMAIDVSDKGELDLMLCNMSCTW